MSLVPNTDSVVLLDGVRTAGVSGVENPALTGHGALLSHLDQL